MSWYKALFLNFASALTSLLGFFVGVAIGTDSEESEEWLLAVIAGQFLYIALVDLVSQDTVFRTLIIRTCIYTVKSPKRTL